MPLNQTIHGPEDKSPDSDSDLWLSSPREHEPDSYPPTTERD